MSKKHTDYSLMKELIAFSSSTEGDIGNLSREEVKARLEANDIDVAGLAKDTERKLNAIKNEMLARKAGMQADLKLAGETPAASTNFAFAARTENQADEEDLEVLRKLTQPDLDEDGTED